MNHKWYSSLFICNWITGIVDNTCKITVTINKIKSQCKTIIKIKRLYNTIIKSGTSPVKFYRVNMSLTVSLWICVSIERFSQAKRTENFPWECKYADFYIHFYLLSES